MNKQPRNARLPEPRWTTEETERVKKKAAKLGLTVSAYLRQAALCYKP